MTYFPVFGSNTNGRSPFAGLMPDKAR
jgi:hypothetical protein